LGNIEARRRAAHQSLSHVFVMDVPGLEHLLLVTDAAINIAPDLQTKVDIANPRFIWHWRLALLSPRLVSCRRWKQ
jgi:phosphate butyryltransferase